MFYTQTSHCVDEMYHASQVLVLVCRTRQQHCLCIFPLTLKIALLQLLARCITPLLSVLPCPVRLEFHLVATHEILRKSVSAVTFQRERSLETVLVWRQNAQWQAAPTQHQTTLIHLSWTPQIAHWCFLLAFWGWIC